jgi:two-component system cell cycle sensor histidine kinase/response regulator CckA
VRIGNKPTIKRETRSGRAADSSASAKPSLRQQAEAKAREKTVRRLENRETLSPKQAQQLLHELRVHQIELEMQNEELRRSQVELESSRERYFNLYDLAPVAYVTLSDKGLVLEANLTAAAQFGIAISALVKQPLTRFILLEDQDRYYRYHKELFKTGQSPRCEMRMVRKDGSSFWAQLEASVAKDVDGAPLCRAVIIDITDRKRVEDLEQAKINEARLNQSQKMEAVGCLATGLAHEINNPLTVILGFSQSLMKRFSAPDDAYVSLSNIEREALRCKALVKDLLTFSRSAPPQNVLEEPVGVINQALNLIETQARLVRVTVRREFKDALPQVPMDRIQVQQVVVNLCSNALDAMPEGGVLTIALERGDHPVDRRPCLLIKVVDTGSGIPEEIRPKIFEPFFSTKVIGKGTGLGLSLVFEIIQRLHGDIAVESKVGQGTTFRVFLPLDAAPKTS